MKQIFRVIRFSSMGVFFAGIIGVIQACSFKQEGLGVLFLLFFLQFCSGPQEEVQEVVTPDPFFIGVAFDSAACTLVNPMIEQQLYVLVFEPTAVNGTIERVVFGISDAGTTAGDIPITIVTLENTAGTDYEYKSSTGAITFNKATSCDATFVCNLVLPTPLSIQAGDVLGIYMPLDACCVNQIDVLYDPVGTAVRRPNPNAVGQPVVGNSVALPSLLGRGLCISGVSP